MRQELLTDDSGQVLLWVEDGQLADHGQRVDLDPGQDLGAAVADWVRAVGGDWSTLRPSIAVPGIAWCPWGADLALVREVGGSWECSDGTTRPTWEGALAHEVRAWAEGDGEPFDIDATDAEVLSGRPVQVRTWAQVWWEHGQKTAPRKRASTVFSGREIDVREMAPGRWVGDSGRGYPTWEAALAAAVREVAEEVGLPFPPGETDADVLHALVRVHAPEEAS